MLSGGDDIDELLAIARDRRREAKLERMLGHDSVERIEVH